MVAVSANAMAVDIEKAMALGVLDVWTKKRVEAGWVHGWNITTLHRLAGSLPIEGRHFQGGTSSAQVGRRQGAHT
jgi:hypothetical protein